MGAAVLAAAGAQKGLSYSRVPPETAAAPSLLTLARSTGAGGAFRRGARRGATTELPRRSAPLCLADVDCLLRKGRAKGWPLSPLARQPRSLSRQRACDEHIAAYARGDLLVAARAQLRSIGRIDREMEQWLPTAWPAYRGPTALRRNSPAQRRRPGLQNTRRRWRYHAQATCWRWH